MRLLTHSEIGICTRHKDKGTPPNPQPLSNSRAAYVPPSYGGLFVSLLPHRPTLGLNSTYFHGTHVPVEEPSKASITDDMSPANEASRIFFPHQDSAEAAPS